MPKLCRCGAIVDKRCHRCQPSHNSGLSAAERGYDHAWRKLSESKRANDPLCEHCLRHGRTTPASEVHHIIPITTAPRLRLDYDNLMSVCHPCHKLLEGADAGAKLNQHNHHQHQPNQRGV